MLVTWIPSSANRLYSLAQTGDINLALEYMSAFVLPLQGFWNAVIYMVTSWKACKLLAIDIWALLSPTTRRRRQPPIDLATVAARKEADGAGAAGRAALRNFARGRSKDLETESMEELAVRYDSIASVA